MFEFARGESVKLSLKEAGINDAIFIAHKGFYSEDNITELENSEGLLTRARLMHELGLLIKSSKLSQKEIAEKLGISQPKVSMLTSVKFNEFSSEKFMHYLSLMGCYVEIIIEKPSRSLFSRKGHIAITA